MCGESWDAYTMSWDESSVIRNTIMEYWNFQVLSKVNRCIFLIQSKPDTIHLLKVFHNYAINKSSNLSLINANIIIMCMLMYEYAFFLARVIFALVSSMFYAKSSRTFSTLILSPFCTILLYFWKHHSPCASTSPYKFQFRRKYQKHMARQKDDVMVMEYQLCLCMAHEVPYLLQLNQHELCF